MIHKRFHNYDSTEYDYDIEKECLTIGNNKYYGTPIKNIGKVLIKNKLFYCLEFDLYSVNVDYESQRVKNLYSKCGIYGTENKDEYNKLCYKFQLKGIRAFLKRNKTELIITTIGGFIACCLANLLFIL